MKKLLKHSLTFLLTFSICIASFVNAFALEKDEIRYSNELTSSPLRIFFAILVVAAFIVSEIAVEKIREKRVKKRNEDYDK